MTGLSSLLRGVDDDPFVASIPRLNRRHRIESFLRRMTAGHTKAANNQPQNFAVRPASSESPVSPPSSSSTVHAQVAIAQSGASGERPIGGPPTNLTGTALARAPRVVPCATSVAGPGAAGQKRSSQGFALNARRGNTNGSVGRDESSRTEARCSPKRSDSNGDWWMPSRRHPLGHRRFQTSEPRFDAPKGLAR